MLKSDSNDPWDVTELKSEIKAMTLALEEATACKVSAEPLPVFGGEITLPNLLSQK